MIILATVIILSLDSSNIIERANEAKEATNLANLKEAANVALAEYKLEVSLGNINSSEISANDYVKDKLEEQGIDSSTMAVSSDGKILTGLTEVAASFVGEGVEVGAVVTGYSLTSNTTTSYTTSGNENNVTYNENDDIYDKSSLQSGTITRDESTTWKYIGVNDNGDALIAADVTSSASKMTLGGDGGYLNGPSELDLACAALYSSSMGTARNMNYEDVTKLLEYNGPQGTYQYVDENSGDAKTIYMDEPKTVKEIALLIGFDMDILACTSEEENYKSNYMYISKTSTYIKAGEMAKNLVFQNTTYWLSSNCVEAYFIDGFARCEVRCVNSRALEAFDLYDTSLCYYSESYAIRPVVELASDVNVSYDGTTVTLSK